MFPSKIDLPSLSAQALLTILDIKALATPEVIFTHVSKREPIINNELQ